MRNTENGDYICKRERGEKKKDGKISLRLDRMRTIMTSSICLVLIKWNGDTANLHEKKKKSQNFHSFIIESQAETTPLPIHPSHPLPSPPRRPFPLPTPSSRLILLAARCATAYTSA